MESSYNSERRSSHSVFSFSSGRHCRHRWKVRNKIKSGELALEADLALVELSVAGGTIRKVKGV